MFLLKHQGGPTFETRHSLANNAIHKPIKVINNRSENPEIMKMSRFDILNNEIGILLYQSEAGEIN